MIEIIKRLFADSHWLKSFGCELELTQLYILLLHLDLQSSSNRAPIDIRSAGQCYRNISQGTVLISLHPFKVVWKMRLKKRSSMRSDTQAYKTLSFSSSTQSPPIVLNLQHLNVILTTVNIWSCTYRVINVSPALVGSLLWSSFPFGVSN